MTFKDNLLTEKAYTAKECVEPNKTISNLWSWARVLEVFGILSAIGVAIFGLVIAIGAGKLAASPDKANTFNFGAFLTAFLPFVLYAFLTYCGFHALALIISAIGSITYNSFVSAKAAVTQTFYSNNSPVKSGTEPSSERASGQNPWEKMSIPGKVPVPNRTSVSKDNYWICPNCGKKQPDAVIVCGCGQSKPENSDN